MYSSGFAILFAACVHLAHGQIQTFLSRPNQTSLVLNVQFNKQPEALAPGYLFLSPYRDDRQTFGNLGPTIYDIDGNLVWDGRYLQEIRAMDTHVCDWLGQKGNHICFTDAVPTKTTGGGHSVGNDRFFDNTYSQVNKDYGSEGNLTGPDIHELNTPDNLNGYAFIQDIYQEVEYDLTMYEGPKQGYVLSGCFQEIEVKTRNINFQWCSDQHVPFYYSYTNPKDSPTGNVTTDGTGKIGNPWDYFHINAIDRDVEGNYYVSSRGTNTIYKIAGNNHTLPGSVIWRLGGKFSDFTIGPGLNFSAQHDVRLHHMNSKTTLLSLFDNHFPQANRSLPKAEASSGKYIQLDIKKMSATLVQQYINPESKFSSTGGSVQTLENGNVFVGYGAQPSISESLPGNPGQAIYYATFDAAYKSYRSYKYPWVGTPHLPPDVFAFQRYCNSTHLTLYMSWNGATEYTGWNIFGTNSSSTSGSEQLQTKIKRTGYETVKTVTPGQFFKYVYVQATGVDGEVMRTSKPTKVFVPSDTLAKTCGSQSCPSGTEYNAGNAKKC